MKILRSAKISLNNLRSIFIFITVFIFVMLSYYFAIEQSGSFESFLNVNSNLFISAQIALSAFSSLLIALSTVLFLDIFKRQKDGGSLGIIETFVALFFSVATTGCYVCGSVLLPVLGVAASFGSLPFAGLEIKFLTILFLLYTLNQLANSYLGTCKIKNHKTYRLDYGSGALNLNFAFLDKIRPIAISFSFIVLIYALPFLIPDNVSAGINADSNPYACSSHSE